MLGLIKKEILINANHKTVYWYISNMERYGNWFPGVIDIRSANNKAHDEEGKRYVETIEFPTGKMEMLLEVQKCELNQEYVIQTDSFAELLPKLIMSTLAEADGCRFIWHWFSRNESLGKQAPMIVELQENVGQRAEQALLKLKSILETSGIDGCTNS